MKKMHRKLFASMLVFALVFTNTLPAYATDEEAPAPAEQEAPAEPEQDESNEGESQDQDSESEDQESESNDSENEGNENDENSDESEENTEEGEESESEENSEEPEEDNEAESDEQTQDDESSEEETEEDEESNDEGNSGSSSNDSEENEDENQEIQLLNAPQAPQPLRIPEPLVMEADLCEETVVENGDIETTSDSMGLVDAVALEDLVDGDWDVFDTIPGWYTDYGTSGIEVHRGDVVFPAHSGEFLIELDSHSNAANGGNTNSAMSQDLELAAGDYNISFAFRPRRANLNDNTIEVLFDDVLIGTADGTDTSAWVEYSFDILDVTEGEHKITFRAAGTANSYGGLLDGITLSRYMVSANDHCLSEVPVFDAIEMPIAAMCTEDEELMLQIRFTETTSTLLTVDTLTEQYTDLSDGEADGVINIPLTDGNGTMLYDSALPHQNDFDGLAIQRLGNGQFELMQGRQLHEDNPDFIEAYLTLGSGEFTAIEAGKYNFEKNDVAEILDPNNSAHWSTKTTGGKDSQVFSFVSNCNPEPTPPFAPMCSAEGAASLLVRFHGDTNLEESVTTEGAVFTDASDGVLDHAITIPLSDANGNYIVDSALPETFEGLALQRLSNGEFRLVHGPSEELAIAEVYLTVTEGEFHSFKNTPNGLGGLELAERFNHIDEVEILDPSNTVSSLTYTTTGSDDLTYSYSSDCLPTYPTPPFEAACTIDGEQMLYVRFTQNTNSERSVATSSETYFDEDDELTDGIIEIQLADSKGNYIVDEEMPEEFDGLAIQRLGDGSIKLRQGPSQDEEVAKKIEAYLSLGEGNFLSATEGDYKLEEKDVTEILDPSNTFHFYAKTGGGKDEVILETENNCELPPAAPFSNICTEDEVLYLDIRFLNRTNTDLLVSTDTEDFSPVEGITRIPLTNESGEFIEDAALPTEFLGLALQRQGEGLMTLSHGPKHNNDVDEIHAFLSLVGADFQSFEDDEEDSLEGPSFNYQDSVEILDPSNTSEWHTYTTTGTDTVQFVYANVTCEPTTEEEEEEGSGSGGGSGSSTGTVVGNNGGGGGGTETGSTETTGSNDGNGGDGSEGTNNTGGDDTTPAPVAFTPAPTTPGEGTDTEVLGEQIEGEEETPGNIILGDLEDEEGLDEETKNYLYGILAALAGLLFLFFAFRRRDDEEEEQTS